MKDQMDSDISNAAIIVVNRLRHSVRYSVGGLSVQVEFCIRFVGVPFDTTQQI